MQLASIPVDSFILRIELPNPELLSDGQDPGVLAPDFLQDSHSHVRNLVAGTIEKVKNIWGWLHITDGQTPKIIRTDYYDAVQTHKTFAPSFAVLWH